MNELIDERVAEVLDGLGLLRSKAKLVEQAANLMSSNAFDAVVWILSMSSSAHFSMHALSHYPAPLLGVRCGDAFDLMYRDQPAIAAP
jgi:hypothetical protein